MPTRRHAVIAGGLKSEPWIPVFCSAARSCKKDVKKYCKAEKKSKDDGAILGCLKCAPLPVSRVL